MANLAAMHGTTSRLAPLQAPALSLPGISHAFFTRPGGVSTGLYEGLNTGTGSGDAREAVLENRARAARFLGVEPPQLVTPYQVHGAETVVVAEVWAPGNGPKADALVTDRPGIAIGVGTADCGPVLFADPEAQVVGAAHAGWKGAVGGILESTLVAMEGLGAERRRIVAVLGPTISADAYEVGPEFVARLLELDPDNKRYVRPSARDGHAFFDLPAYIVDRLGRAGIAAVHNLALCTYSDEKRFFSYRRSTHRGEPDYGRLLAAISIQEH